MNRLSLSLLTAALFIMLFPAGVKAEEGMWTFDNLPRAALKEHYGFSPSGEWIDHARLSSVKFRNGSGSFITSTGLVLTNHHVVRGELAKLSTAEKDYVKNGFYAPTQADERACPDMELKVLAGMENVTARIESAVKGMTPPGAALAKKKEITELEKAHKEKTGNLGEVITLYHGGEYWLYSYRRYTDVRLVFAPENQVSLFGGQYDNFTFPRYDLDFALFRVYENGSPAAVQHYFPVNPGGVKENEPVFTIGHPGTTSRQLTTAQVLFMRDIYYPAALAFMKHSIHVLETYSRKGEEQARQALAQIHSLENSLKRAEGEYAGLSKESTMKRFQEGEKKLHQDLQGRAELMKSTGNPWGAIEKTTCAYKDRFTTMYYIPREEKLLSQALQIVFLAKELQKPDSERLSGYRSSQLESLKRELLSQAPVYREMEESLLADYLAVVKEKCLERDSTAYITTLLEGTSPEARAHELLMNSTLDRADTRKALVEGGQRAIDESKDALILLARKLEPMKREIMKWNETEYVDALAAQHEKIARARFSLYGKSVYPDGTSTLRVAYGTVKGYPYNGTIAPAVTTFYGLYDRYYSFNSKNGAWALPQHYIDKVKNVELSTILDFANTCDTTGGNSGSPVINRNGEIVGLNFDSNMEGLSGRYVYNFEAKRAIAVNLGAIVEVLRHVYGAGRLADEMVPHGR